jgi:hypothetical protein
VVADVSNKFFGKSSLTGQVKSNLESKPALIDTCVAQAHGLFDFHADDAPSEKGCIHMIEGRSELGRVGTSSTNMCGALGTGRADAR